MRSAIYFLKISHSQTLKLLNEHVRNLLLKIIRTPPQALNKCIRNLLLKIIRTTNFEQPFFKLLRNERISRCAIYFARLSARIILTALLRFVEKEDPWFERKQYESSFT